MPVNKIVSFFLAFILLLLSAGSTTAAAPRQAEPIASGPLPTDRIIIQYNPTAEVQRDAVGQLSAGELETLSQRSGVRLTYAAQLGDGLHVLQMEQALPVDEVLQIAQALAADPAVAYAEPDYIMTTQLVPNDEHYSYQWHYRLSSGNYGANLPAAWDVTTGDEDVVVAVVDTGSLPHPDLAGRLLPGYDFVSYSSNPAINIDRDPTHGWDNDPTDPGTYGDNCVYPYSSWHGLHVIGTIGANSNNGSYASGVTWQNDILPVRALGICGSGYTSDILSGVRWAAGLSVSGVPANPNPARVINLSLGGEYPCSSTWQTAINEVRALGKMIVVAAGNSSRDAGEFTPASCQGVITVAATHIEGDLAGYSNYGSTVEISAPGGDFDYDYGIVSLGNDGDTTASTYNSSFKQGTSMAAPHVSGVVGLMLSVNSELTLDWVTRLLQERSTAFPGGSRCAENGDCGAGILNAGAAVQEALDLFRLKYPNEFEIVYAGRTGSLRPITIRTFENGAISLGAFSVTIGGSAATVTAAVDRGSYWEATVQPPAKANGIYDITVSVNGLGATHQKSVIYGVQTFLPNVRR